MKAKTSTTTTSTRTPLPSLPLSDATPSTLYFTKLFTSGPLKGLTANESMTTYDLAGTVAWVNRHRTVPVKPLKGFGLSAYIISDASFQSYERG